MQTTLKTLAAFIATIAIGALAGNPLPRGLMLNLDFQKIENGLIPNKTLYPLYVPICDLDTAPNNSGRVLLMIEAGQGFDIPHSSLLDPDGESVPDPIGQPLAVYTKTAQFIGQAIEKRIGEWM